MTLHFGNTAVPYTVSWSGENRFFVDRCPYSDRLAICQSASPGVGKPQFGKPHSCRQREAIARNLCDICGKSLKNRTRVSLSHARVRGNAAAGGTGILQVEPLLHRECAAISLRFCPSLRRDIAAGSLMVRQVGKTRVQFAIMAPEYVREYVPDYVFNSSDRIVGHAKVELISWVDRDEQWLYVAAHGNPPHMAVP